MELNTYLIFNGNCEAAFKFYEKCFGGKINAMLKNAGSPAAEHVPADWQDKILHAHMNIGDSVLMASDAPPERSAGRPQGFSVNISLKYAAEGERIFNALSEGGKVNMPFQQTFWAYRFGMVVDQFGTPWMINCEQPW